MMMGIVEVAPCRLGRGGRPRDDHVDREPHELGREGGKPFAAVPVPSALDDDVLALDVAEVSQPLEECPPEMRRRRAVRGGPPEKADAMDLRRRLRFHDERRGEGAPGTARKARRSTYWMISANPSS